MSTRVRESAGRGRGRQYGVHIEIGEPEVGEVEVPHAAHPSPVVADEESAPPTEHMQHTWYSGDAVGLVQQSSHNQISSPMRTRGETQGNHAPNHCDSRTFIQPFHDGFIPKLTTRRVMAILRKYMGPWPTWEQVPWERKDFLFEKFREHFTWLPEHEAGIKYSWEQTHKRNFKNTIYRYKKKAIKEVGGDDPKEIQKIVPKNMSSADWEAICNGHMSVPNYQDKCRKAKQNRLTEKDGLITKHSISFSKHARRMVENGRVVSQVEIHDRIHRRGKEQSEYVDNKSKRVRDEYEPEYTSQHGSNSTPESSFDAKKCLEISGGPCKVSMAPPPEYISQEQLQDAISKALHQELAKRREATAIKKTTLIEEAFIEELGKLAKEREEAAIRETALIEVTKNLKSLVGDMMAELKKLKSGSSSHGHGGENKRDEHPDT